LDPVPTTPPVGMGFRHCYAMCTIKDGNMYFLPKSMRNNIDTTSKGIRRAIDQGGMQILSFHDVFNYLEGVMHFADKIQKEEDVVKLWGNVDFEDDVKKPNFFSTF